MASRGRPTAKVAVVDGAWGAASLVTEFQLTSAKDDFATVLHDLGSGLESRLTGLVADRVVVRRADLSQVPSNQEGPRLRLLAEGALVAAARRVVDDVLVLTGRDLGARSPAGSKAGLDAEASRTLAGSDVEAAAAALAGLAP